MQLIDGDKIREIEPYCRGVKAIWSPETGIVDWCLVTNYYGTDFIAGGGKIYLDFEAKQFKESSDPDHPVLIQGPNGKTIMAKNVLTCGGLQSDKIAEKTGCPRVPRIVPFR